MKIKSKLTFGIAFLFAAFLAVGGSSLYFIFNISKQNKLIMKDNQLSLGYTENMLQTLDKIQNIQLLSVFNNSYRTDSTDLKILLGDFEKNMALENGNITEIGEREKVDQLQINYTKFKKLLFTLPKVSENEKHNLYLTNILPVYNEIKNIIYSISDLNTHAIIRKNDFANLTVSRSYVILSFITSVCLLFFFSFIFSFPSYILRPINEIAEGVTQISKRNFSYRLNFNSKDEMGEISRAFNDMASKLEEFSYSQESFQLFGKEMAEAALNKIDYPLILINEYQKITFLNTYAEKLLKLSSFDTINQTVYKLALKNDLLRTIMLDFDQKTDTDPYILVDFNGKNVKFEKIISAVSTVKKDNELITPIGHIILLKPQV
jgi:two-component system, NtrC family, sensor histidine kinase KinB